MSPVRPFAAFTRPSEPPGGGDPGGGPDFERTYREHFAFVWRSLRRLGVPVEHLDDAAQEVFLVVHRRLGDFDGRVGIRSWLFGISHKVSLGHRRASRHLHAVGPLGDELPATTADPHRRAEVREAVRFLEAFLATLADSQRSVFVLAELEQMSAPEIADALSMKLNTVYSRLRLARAAFRAAVQGGRARGS